MENLSKRQGIYGAIEKAFEHKCICGAALIKIGDVHECKDVIEGNVKEKTKHIRLKNL